MFLTNGISIPTRSFSLHMTRNVFLQHPTRDLWWRLSHVTGKISAHVKKIIFLGRIKHSGIESYYCNKAYRPNAHLLYIVMHYNGNIV